MFWSFYHEIELFVAGRPALRVYFNPVGLIVTNTLALRQFACLMREIVLFVGALLDVIEI